VCQPDASAIWGTRRQQVVRFSPVTSTKGENRLAVLVLAEWPVPAENADAFVRTMRHVGRARRRTGATRWGLFHDVADPALFVEAFVVDNWHEHLRQHLERGTAMDRDTEARAHGP
jgi:hypothetical protein